MAVMTVAGAARPADARPRSVSRSAEVPTDVDAYIAGFAPEIQAILARVRAVVRAAAPGASEVISYRMPALKQHGVLIYFAAFRNHLGFYPPVTGDPALEAEAARYAGEKGNLRFPLDEPVPYDLIARLTRLRAEQDAARHADRQAAPARRAAVAAGRGRAS